MSVIRQELAHAAIARSLALNVHSDIHKRYEFQKQTVLADDSLTKDEKTFAINWLTKGYDYLKILFNSGTKRICENCKQECLATLYCEFCVRNYLKTKFSNWTSGNDDIDNLIQKCQLETLLSSKIIEWIPYNKLRNIKYLTKGGFSEIYTADWIDGRYEEWDSEKQQLKRMGGHEVVLKKLENVESANQSWFEEAKSHLTIGNKWADIIQCYGLTQNISNGNYMLIMMNMDINLREYLYQNHNRLTWKEKINITFEIIRALNLIHTENAIHRDLHSGNILYSQLNDRWFISDLGFCGPADKSSKCIYGNLPYVAPEVINGKEYTFKSDIYSIAMLMWEISSEQSPFINHEHDYDLAINIINGIRPRIVSGTPVEYKNLMEKCWDADPSKRPDVDTLLNKIAKMNQSTPDESFQSEIYRNLEQDKTNSSTNSKLFTSKIHQFENLPEPRNATEEELEAFHSNKSYDFNIPNNIDDFNKSSNQNSKASKISSIFKANSKKLSKMFEKLQIKNKTTQQTKGATNIANFNDEDETYNNPNFHSEEQNELEIPDDV
ncbi:kinase-like domain-containing protein [Rhizophagus irregularis DAOM 181602=DAOM 197198]|uniref:Kinase-like domain-containing protein n=1 Tax=Rhizophagus irregularis (strain DAOM 181602 / DAOM 197198 / MUCL 43194) TaxID=747089 RepID=A0A2H5RGN6_RHIID|nr:kinase-like domain-containing protein [Rhizophagus irregularis DAOM 181602=DAOM 197198]POG75409.1 kinase-like domain-containing protein [Rhizophagus irregularis DAOM 181602=DAOM 197198]|eukprot:XP_025182275.1 kinase-like domain-containing protein [Rhizophagus irregularis DAOM 181602=DAOM 197198]